ncbi:MAG: aminotransferase class I/II-fold pyridoxal phosphate-dependent enzyme, partial [Clostridiales bacterium]|nr:aminotransferase class I/II-fold pyridoxal phosphate-dependent enzyme [Clostridiales bacterium]
MSLSNRALGVSPSLTLAITAKAKKMKADGLDVISFGAGEPDFDTPAYIIEAAKVALDKGITRYTPASGTVELRKAICDKLARENGVTYDVNEIVVSNGAKHSLSNAIRALVQEG